MKSFLPNLSLRAKIILLVSGMSFFSAAALGGVNLLRAREITQQKAVAELAGETRIASLQVKGVFDSMKNDAFMLAHNPAIQGLIATIGNGGVDGKDGTTSQFWRQHLNAIFTSLIQARPNYTQIRYIGRAGKGRELVRVNRREDGAVQVVEPAELQPKAEEPYFKAGLQLTPNKIYFSDVTYNREHGSIDPALTPTIRAVFPVFDERRERFGMVVINANYEKILRQALSSLKNKNELYISDNSGNYLRREANGKISKLEVAGHWSDKPPGFIQRFLQKSEFEGSFTENGRVGYFHRRHVASSASAAAIGMFVLDPEPFSLADMLQLIDQSVITAFLLMTVSVIAAGLLSDHLTRPMVQMTATIKAFSAGKVRTIKLPVDMQDEVGEMARAFRDLIGQLDLSHAQHSKLSVKLEAFIANSVDGVVLINEHGVIEETSPSCSDLFGYERDELIGSNVSILMPDDIAGKHDGYLRAYRETGVKNYIGAIRDEKARRKDGAIFPIALSITEVRLSDRRLFTGVIRDMTAVKQAWDQIEGYAAELERSNQELDQFAYIASHDLKAPLRVIDNASRWLEEDLDEKLGDEDRENLQLLRNRVKRMEKLLDDLLDYSRVGRAARGDDEIVDARGLIDEVLLLLAPPETIQVTIADRFNTVQVTRVPLQQIFYNLINNAIKHHDRESGLIEIGVEETETHYRFSVKDDGPGIAPEFQEKIFGMFQTLKPRDQVEGSGMGLALVKKIVEHFGETIAVTSSVGEGAEFSFTWPKSPQIKKKSEKAA